MRSRLESITPSLHPRSQAGLGLRVDVQSLAREYRRRVPDASQPEPLQSQRLRKPLLAPALAVGGFAVWAYVPRAPLWATSLVVLVPVVAAQRSGQLEPLLFEASLVGFIAGCWAASLRGAVA